MNVKLEYDTNSHCSGKLIPVHVKIFDDNSAEVTEIVKEDKQMTTEKYRCRGCSWTCLVEPNTEVPMMPKGCFFAESKELPIGIKPLWERDCR